MDEDTDGPDDDSAEYSLDEAAQFFDDHEPEGVAYASFSDVAGPGRPYCDCPACDGGTVYEHRPQWDDPDYAVAIGDCDICGGTGYVPVEMFVGEDGDRAEELDDPGYLSSLASSAANSDSSISTLPQAATARFDEPLRNTSAC